MYSAKHAVNLITTWQFLCVTFVENISWWLPINVCKCLISRILFTKCVAKHTNLFRTKCYCYALVNKIKGYKINSWAWKFSWIESVKIEISNWRDHIRGVVNGFRFFFCFFFLCKTPNDHVLHVFTIDAFDLDLLLSAFVRATNMREHQHISWCCCGFSDQTTLIKYAIACSMQSFSTFLFSLYT